MNYRNKIIKILQKIAEPIILESLLDNYEKMISEFLLENYEGVLIKCGKFIEDFHQLLDFIIRKNIASKPNLPKIRERLKKAVDGCIIPSSINYLIADSLHIGYRFRNSRDGAHSVDFIANKIDSKYVINISKWCIAELIRTYSTLSESECLLLVDRIMKEPIPHIQRFGKNDVLVLHTTSASNEILILIYFSEEKSYEENYLKNKIKHHSRSNITTSLNNLEKKRFIFRNDGIVYLTKTGEKYIIDVLEKLKNNFI